MDHYVKPQSITIATKDFLDQSSQEESIELLTQDNTNANLATSKLVAKTIRKEFPRKRSFASTKKYCATKAICKSEGKNQRKTSTRTGFKEEMDYTIEYIPLTPSPNYDSSEEEDVTHETSSEKSLGWNEDFLLEANSWSLMLKQSMMRLKHLEIEEVSRYLSLNKFQLSNQTVRNEAEFSLLERNPETISNYFLENILPFHCLKLLNTFHPMCQLTNTLDQFLFAKEHIQVSNQGSLVALDDAPLEQHLDYKHYYDIKMKTHY